MNKRYEDLLKQMPKTTKVILEVGTYDGENASRMIYNALKNNGFTSKKIIYYGFDLFEKAPDYELPKDAPSLQQVETLIKMNCGETAEIHLIQGNTRETLPTQRPSRKVDFIFIDGGHSVDTIRSDWLAIYPTIYENTVVVFDDYYHNRNDIGAKDIVEELQEDGRFNVEFFGDINSFETEMGRIDVQMVKVTLK